MDLQENYSPTNNQCFIQWSKKLDINFDFIHVKILAVEYLAIASW